MWQLSSLENKVAFVSGASRGIGQAIALLLGKMGATVIGSATTAEGAEKISDYLAQNNFKGSGVVLDVKDTQAIQETIKKVTDEFGPVQVLVNNAGITRDNLLMRMKDEEWDETLQTNLTGVYQLTKACLRGMLKAKWGRIISISSVVGAMGNPGQANYAAAKAGVIAFSKSLAKELGSRQVTVNVVAPGFIETDMTHQLSESQQDALMQHIPLGRLGQANDVASCVAFLASEQAGYITGETLHVNGGMLMG